MSRQLPPGLPGKTRGRKAGWIARAGAGAVLFTVLALTRAVLGIMFGAFKRSEVYAEAIARATSDPEVRRELGEPVRAGWWVSGRLSVTGPSGEARFATPLRGPEGHGTLSAHARKRRGRWNFEVLEVAVEGRIEPIRLALLILLLLGPGPIWAGSARTTQDCEEAKRANLWCSAESVGNVAGVAIRSAFLYEALDAHGHDVEPAALSCRVCRRHSRGIGWCDRHRVGIADRFLLDDRQEFDQMQKAYGVLLAAVEISSRCETCAAAMVADGYCAPHRVHYKDGRAASGSPP